MKNCSMKAKYDGASRATKRRMAWGFGPTRWIMEAEKGQSKNILQIWKNIQNSYLWDK